MNKSGKSAKPFTRLQRKAGLQIVKENFGVIDERVLDDIERETGRRPTKQAVWNWGHPKDAQKANEGLSTEPKASASSQQPKSTAVNDDQRSQQALRTLISLDEGPEKTIDERAVHALDVLIDIPDSEIRKLSPEKRLRLFPALSEAWLKRRGVDEDIAGFAPYIREYLAACDRLNIDAAHLLKRHVESLNARALALAVQTPALSPGED